MTAETDKDYMRVAMNIEGNIHQTYEFSDEAIQRATESQIQKNLEERSKEEDFRMTHNADDAYFDRMYEDKPTPYRDLIRNNPVDWDEFIEDHLSAYPDFKQWVYNFQHKGQAPLEVLKRIIERAIKDRE